MFPFELFGSSNLILIRSEILMLYCKIVSKSGRTPFAQRHDSPYVHICICVHMDMFCLSFFVMGLVFTVFTQANLKLLNSQAWSLWHGVYGDHMSQPPWSCHIISILLIFYMYNWNSLYSFQFWILSRNYSTPFKKLFNLFKPFSTLINSTILQYEINTTTNTRLV